MGDVADAAAPDAAFVALYINGCQVRHATDPPRMTMKLLDRDGTPLATVADVVDKALAAPEFFPCKFQKLVRRAVASAKKGVRCDVGEDTVRVLYDWLRDPASELRISL